MLNLKKYLCTQKQEKTRNCGFHFTFSFLLFLFFIIMPFQYSKLSFSQVFLDETSFFCGKDYRHFSQPPKLRTLAYLDEICYTFRKRMVAYGTAGTVQKNITGTGRTYSGNGTCYFFAGRRKQPAATAGGKVQGRKPDAAEAHEGIHGAGSPNDAGF
jgi:hypothetical protein